jgi:hypothetical protein
VAELLPGWDGAPIATMLHSETDAPVKALDTAIKAKDAVRPVQALWPFDRRL